MSATLSTHNPGNYWTGRKKTISPARVTFSTATCTCSLPQGNSDHAKRTKFRIYLKTFPFWIFNPLTQLKGMDENYMKQNLSYTQKWNVLKTCVFCMWCDFQPQAFFIQLLKYHNYHHHHHRLQSHSMRDSEIRHPQFWMAQTCSLSQPVWERIKPWCPTGVVLKQERAPESPGGLTRHRL